VCSQVQIEIARKQADALIATQGMHLQTQLARFANEKIEDLNSTINNSRTHFLDQMEPQFEVVKRYEHRPELHKPAYAALLHQIAVYFDSTKELLDGFSSSLHSKIGSVQQ
jgi:hypothetical protein